MHVVQIQMVALVIAAVATVAGLGSFIRGIVTLVARVRHGQSDPGRLTPVGRRTWMLISTVLSHREFRSRPVVRVAHWFVMLSFPILFLTLVTGYGQLTNPEFSLPLIGHFLPWEWVTEVFAWGCLLGIVALVIIRVRAGSGGEDEAVGHDDAGVPVRDGAPSTRISRFLGSTRWQAYFVEFVITAVALCVLLLRGADYVLATRAAEVSAESFPPLWHFPLTAWIGTLFSPMSDSGITIVITVVSMVKIVVSMLWMMVVGIHTTMGVAWHRFLAIVSVYARRNPTGRKALGAAAPLLVDGTPITSDDDVENLDDDAVLGVGTDADWSWKARLDFMTCTECGRCQELCPAWNTGKPLSPKLLMLSLRDHAAAVELTESIRERNGATPDTRADDSSSRGEGDDTGDSAPVVVDADWPERAHSSDVLAALRDSGNTGSAGVALTSTPLVGEVVSEDALWDCTTCGACVDQCPVDIEHVDHILNLRRHQVLMESAFPRELARPFRSLETKGNPYNQSPRKRMDWAKNLDFDVLVIGEDVEDASEVDWVFWVGCAGAFDDRAKKTSAAIAELLHVAGVRFAVLGNAESCTGDPARRSGNELLFQMLARQAIDTLNEAKVTRIVVSCAHCFNTIANEYPQLGGTFEVVHHTQLLNRLVREGALRLAPANTTSATANTTTPNAATPNDTEPTRRITYHDPCYLGRHNRVFTPPRELLGSLADAEIVEMPRSGERAMCCGAGGARAWMEETRGVRISQARMDEASATGATTVATACPFCSQMLGSSSSDVEIADVAVLMRDAVRRSTSAQ